MQYEMRIRFIHKKKKIHFYTLSVRLERYNVRE